ncbi:hypothetical protein P153DRAFT_382381 [Dothidotthia symphoricarpi CBS 119687]|uniref:Secreted protein n=1 Tax=Dothidotthia symphoricarpi CBS 119687 TaxID=1392245 RepID=A0A6A6AMG1_9PLEO|nr:uncharacterized protein P153DRAFT_382381 [Dothidotthia symphoricarpi CBS 119687]KAF2132756.1 hypothetical protein P153DRAFT_382381 [Dothidotthia symphoricarpi CBS 119687]
MGLALPLCFAASMLTSCLRVLAPGCCLVRVSDAEEDATSAHAANASLGVKASDRQADTAFMDKARSSADQPPGWLVAQTDLRPRYTPCFSHVEDGQAFPLQKGFDASHSPHGAASSGALYVSTRQAG